MYLAKHNIRNKIKRIVLTIKVKATIYQKDVFD